MRVSKKFVGVEGLGRRVTAQKHTVDLTPEEKSNMELKIQEKRSKFITKEAMIEASNKSRNYRRSAILKESGLDVQGGNNDDTTVSAILRLNHRETSRTCSSRPLSSNPCPSMSSFQTTAINQPPASSLLNNYDSQASSFSYLISDDDDESLSEQEKLFIQDWMTDTETSSMCDDVPRVSSSSSYPSLLSPSSSVVNEKPYCSISSAQHSFDASNTRVYYLR
eukprot:CAMPEP_0182426560 /NCGR_PEP_ID=MMETSP1167-20130531/13057_1 /TAXON_ID=2988 /ORGANISM="Mallomonas Sp, Strain CCMP3275" /LENGTH=221 /DNA_ID=CAMNT_0024608071 /DNA_START=324 /DNA_END=989 /DNA_ORIENTATION=+